MRYGKCKTGPFPLFSREAETASFCLFFSVFPRGHAEVRLERPVEIGEVFESAPGGDGQDGLVRGLQRLGGGALWSWCSMGLCALFYALLLFLFARDEVRSLAAWLLPSRRGAQEPPKNADAASNREGGASD
mgnify:CR=1 FL=1